jgi:methylenetetrahydrofolate dehydrogenase (NADP+)/methenyltetrahydrofolate cyclohydrolase
LGIIVQLPLAAHLQFAKDQILDAVLPHKDIDGLWSTHISAWNTPEQIILPATAQAVLALLDFYAYGEVKDTPILVIGQSNLVWLPLTLALQQRGAQVATATSETTRDHLCAQIAQATIIISATGQIGMIGSDFLPFLHPNHILIDVGRGLVEGKPVGDTDRELLASHVKAITPVPWGVGPLTIACLFANMCRLHNHFHAQ